MLPIDTLETALISADDPVQFNCTVQIKGKRCAIESILDTGASLSVIDREYARNQGLYVERLRRTFNCRTGSGYITITHLVRLR